MYFQCGHTPDLRKDWTMEDKSKYFVVKQKAVPEVLLKVVEAKKLLETERAITVQEATDKVGISRSSFYKYKDDIFPFYDNTKGKTITLVVQMDDEQGLLSDLLHVVAVYRANILNYSPEHSGQRRGNAYAERGGKGEYRQCIQHDRGTGSIGRNPLRQNTCQGVMTGSCLSISEENKTQGAEDYD